MAFKLKDGSGVEHTYDQKKLKIPGTTEGETVVFTEGEVQTEKTADIAENGAFTVEPDAGYAFVRKVSGTVAVPTPEPDLQEKSVNITSNGQTTVQPDSGKDGLSKVDITVAVPATSGYQLRTFGTAYESTEEFSDFIDIVIQAASGSLEPPSGWGFPMFPLGVLLYLENNPVICWCSTLVDNDTQEIRFPGTFYVEKKVGHIECRYFAGSDNMNHFEVDSLELDGEDILSQVTGTTIIVVATLFPTES